MQVLDSPDTVSEDAMCLKRDLPDVFYLNRRCEIIATSCSPIAGIAKTALVLDDQIVSTIRLEMLASAKDREPMTQQFACDGKFVRVLELDGEAGLIVLVERLRNRAGSKRSCENSHSPHANCKSSSSSYARRVAFISPRCSKSRKRPCNRISSISG